MRMDDQMRRLPWDSASQADLTPLVEHEWLVTNGLGGYASGTIAGLATRRYHGLLIAAHPAPLGRQMMFNQLWEFVRLPDWTTVPFGGVERHGGAMESHGSEHLLEFRLESGLPVWLYQLGPFVVEKRLFMPHQQNTVYIAYRMVAGQERLRLKLQPGFHLRGHDEPVGDAPAGPHIVTAHQCRYEVVGPNRLALRLHLEGERAAFTLCSQTLPDIHYRIEESRGYEYTGSLWSPGQFRVDLTSESPAILVASTEDWE